MKHRSRLLSLSLSLSVAAGLAGCGGGGGSSDTTPAPTPAPSPAPAGFAGGDVDLKFVARSGDTAIDCTTPIPALGTASTPAKLQDLRFYVSNVRFVKADGSDVPLSLTVVTDDFWHHKTGTDTLSLIDLETTACGSGGTSATNDRIGGTLPSGDYVGIRFTVGVPEALNHLDPTAESTPFLLRSTSLGWDWTSGRMFSRIEVTDPARATAPTWTDPVFTAHLGAIGCVGDPALLQPVTCTRPNRMAIDLGTSGTPFDPTRQAIAIDLAGLLRGNDVRFNTPATASGCMSAPDDPECGPMFDAMQISLTTGLPIDGGRTQRVFRAVSR